MCMYCGNIINGSAVELMVDNHVIQLCDEECAILYLQEQQQSALYSWVKFR